MATHPVELNVRLARGEQRSLVGRGRACGRTSPAGDAPASTASWSSTRTATCARLTARPTPPRRCLAPTPAPGTAATGPTPCASLEVVELPETLLAVGTCAFEGCSSLGAVRLPPGVTSIGARAFAGCTALAAIELPCTFAAFGCCRTRARSCMQARARGRGTRVRPGGRARGTRGGRATRGVPPPGHSGGARPRGAPPPGHSGGSRARGAPRPHLLDLVRPDAQRVARQEGRPAAPDARAAVARGQVRRGAGPARRGRPGALRRGRADPRRRVARRPGRPRGARVAAARAAPLGGRRARAAGPRAAVAPLARELAARLGGVALVCAELWS